VGPQKTSGRLVIRWRRWWPAVRIVITVAMLGALAYWVKWGSILPRWDAATFAWLAGGVACSALAIVLSAVRWERVLSAMELPTKIGRLVHASLASQFVSSSLPSTIGGDALRVTRLSARSSDNSSPSAPAAFASVVLDRMSGWLILPLLCLLGLVINPSLLHLGRSSRAAVILSAVTLFGLVATIAVALNPRLGGRFADREGWLKFMGAVHLGLERIRRRPGAAAQVVGVSALYQLAMVGASLLACRALDIRVGPTALLAFVPAVAIVQVLPVTIGGLGLREGAFALFLHPLGVSVDRAVALGLALYAIHLISSLLGAPSFAFARRVPDDDARAPRPVDPLAPAA
jgi:uncharacterized membrane protein YbhN (UPF0104 family)